MLRISNSCEIEDLILEVVKVSGKSYLEVEEAFFSLAQYPTGTKTYLLQINGKIIQDRNFEWLDIALNQIFTECNITDCYITSAI